MTVLCKMNVSKRDYRRAIFQFMKHLIPLINYVVARRDPGLLFLMTFSCWAVVCNNDSSPNAQWWRTHGRRRPSLRIANGGGETELTSSAVLLTSNQQHTRLLTKSAASNKVLLMNQLPTSSPRSSSTKTTPSWQHEYFLINDQSLYFF